MGRFLLKFRFFLSLLTWQTSLIIASLAALLLSGIVVIASPEAVENEIINVKASRTSVTDPTIVRFEEDMDDITLFVYDKLSSSTKPLDIEIHKGYPYANELDEESDIDVEKGAWFEIYPGAYEFVFIKPGYETIEKDFVVKVGQKRILFKLEFLEQLPVDASPFSSPLSLN